MLDSKQKIPLVILFIIFSFVILYALNATAELKIKEPIRTAPCQIESVDVLGNTITISVRIHSIFFLRRDIEKTLIVKEESVLKRRSEEISLSRIVEGEVGTARYFVNEQGRPVLISLYLE